MSIPLIINGVTFQYPQQFDKNWGPTLTNWSSAVTSGMLQKAGGSFTLTSEVDFGSSFGIAVKSVKSKETNIASTGYLRLGNASPGLVWRNAANSADLPLTVNASNQLTFNGTSIGATTSLTNAHILVGNVSNQPADVAMSGDTTITNAGVITIANSAITDAKVSSSAAITLSKLAATTAYYWYAANSSGVLSPLGVTASRAVITDANGLPSASSTTSTELGYVHGVTSALQTQINGLLPLSGGTMTGVLNMGSQKIVSVANGASAGDAVAFGQLIANNIVGTATNDNAPAGNIGEFVSSSGGPTNFASVGTFGNFGSVSLTAGDWDVSGGCVFGSNGASGITTWQLVLSAFSGNTTTDHVVGYNVMYGQPTPPNTVGTSIPRFRASLSTTTTIYIKGRSDGFSGGPPNGTWAIQARRVR